MPALATRNGDDPTSLRFGFRRDDGGRQAAGFSERAGDCVLRAITIATAGDYATHRKGLMDVRRESGNSRGNGVFDGMFWGDYRIYLGRLGWEWVQAPPKTYLRHADLPKGKTLIVQIARHLLAVVDGVVRDTWDSRVRRKTGEGLPLVHGYFIKPDDVPGDVSLTALVDECRSYVSATRNIVVRGVALGQKLSARKRITPHGEWERWVRRNLPIQPRMVQHLMVIAQHADFVLSDPKLLTLADAIRAIRKLHAPEKVVKPTPMSAKRTSSAVRDVLSAVQAGTLTAQQRRELLAALRKVS